MPKGGHGRTGPPKDPNSRTSERVGYTLTALPNEGYRGEVPDLTSFLVDATARHEAVWAELWSTPQACAWSQERWRWPVVADLAKWMVRSDDPDAPASIATSIRQLRDDCGLSKVGLAANGWSIAPVEVGGLSQAEESSPEGDEVGARRQKRLR